MAQESIIDSIKKTIVLKKTFKFSKSKIITFDNLLIICQKLFSHKFSKNSWKENFKYYYIDKNRKKKNTTYFVEKCFPEKKIISITRESEDGKYTTTLEIKKNKIYYFESVILKEVPFQIWGVFGKYIFKKNFKKRLRIIKEEIKKYE